MLRNLLICTVFFITGVSVRASIEEPAPASQGYALYAASGLEHYGVSLAVFERAREGFLQVSGRQKEILTLIDFSKPSSAERLFVVDMNTGTLLHHSLVAHGQGSGDQYATTFSNREGSHQSSLGFFLVSETYLGGKGYSLRLDGLEDGINDHARSRAVVVHGAAYCSEDFIRSFGRLGRSFGCPALPLAQAREIIDTIKEGSVLYIYAPDPTYLAHSRY